MTGSKCGVHCVAWILVIIGGLNWGLVGFFDWNLVDAIFASVPAVARVVYALVGLSALMMLFTKKCSKCMVGGSAK